MEKLQLTKPGILGIIFLFILIIYSATASGFTKFLHLVLLGLGLSISILLINKLTKSSNSSKSKIYFSLIVSFLIFFSIIFFWFLGNHDRIDEKGLVTGFIIIPSVLFFGIVSFIIGIVLSIKRKEKKDFDYDLKPLLWIFSICSLILVVLFFYNTAFHSLAISTNNKEICYLTISPNLNSNLFNEKIKSGCLLEVSTEESKTGDITCGDLRDINDRNSCYLWTAQYRGDIKICIDNVVSDSEVLKYNEYCGSAITTLEDEIYNILKDPRHPDIMYAIRSVPEFGVYYDESAKAKFIPLIKNIVEKGSLESKKASLDILFKLAEGDLEEEKRILKKEVLPLIINQPELKYYVDRINVIQNSVILEPISIS